MSAFVELTNGPLYWTLEGCVPFEKFVLSSPKRSCVLQSVTIQAALPATVTNDH